MFRALTLLSYFSAFHLNSDVYSSNDLDSSEDVYDVQRLPPIGCCPGPYVCVYVCGCKHYAASHAKLYFMEPLHTDVPNINSMESLLNILVSTIESIYPRVWLYSLLRHVINHFLVQLFEYCYSHVLFMDLGQQHLDPTGVSSMYKCSRVYIWKPLPSQSHHQITWRQTQGCRERRRQLHQSADGGYDRHVSTCSLNAKATPKKYLPSCAFDTFQDSIGSQYCQSSLGW